MSNATLTLNTQSLELPVYSASLGPDVVDVGALTGNGHFTYDPGFVSTAACESKITYIDGDKGVLLHRGYPIEELAEKSDYMETCYLLLNGELPNQTQKNEWINLVKKHSHLSAGLEASLKALSPKAHPMAQVMTLLSVLSAEYQENQPTTPEARFETAASLVAKIPMMIANIYRHTNQLPALAYKPELSYAENFMHMTFGKDVDPVLVRAMDVIFILHADHEQNASTSTTRMVGSTGANAAASLAAGAAALWGPAHGGANEACLNMLKTIGDVSRIPEYLARAKDKNDSFRLMGFGHRVYKNFDPRAKIMRNICHDVLNATNSHNTPLFKLAVELERIALEDSYFIERKLYPNVDFYSGLTLQAIGIPTEMFTTIFALARTVGWMSHWNEMLNSSYKLARPRQWYTGEQKRAFQELNERK